MNALLNKAELIDVIVDVQQQIQDDYRAFEEDEEPGIQLTIGVNDSGDWNYQTGDNSFTGNAYGYPDWGVVGVYRDSDPDEIAEDILSQLTDLRDQ